jgi:hypothetical protein
MVRTLFLLVATLLAGLAQAQEVTIDVFPDAPASSTPITVFITRPGCPTEFLGRTGNVLLFREGEICVLPPGDTDEHFVGFLPAGTYTIRVELVSVPEVFDFPLVVAAATPAEVPAVDVYGAIALTLMLAGIAARRVMP